MRESTYRVHPVNGVNLKEKKLTHYPLNAIYQRIEKRQQHPNNPSAGISR